MTEINEASWLDIEKSMPPFGCLNAHRVIPEVDLFLAVDHNGYRHALLLLGSADQALTDDRSRGLTVRGRKLEVEGQPERPFLDMTCTDRSGHNAFNLVISEVLHHLAAGAGAVNAVMTTLARWRRFWGSAPGSGLSREQLRGLFGELWFMLVWLMPHGVGNVRHWVGPSGARHDFQWLTFSIEAKATESIRGHVHHINGLDQLDHPENGRLYLYSLRIREEPASSNSLVSLIQRIGDLLTNKPELLDLYEERLAQAGYSPIHAERYSQTRFRVVSERLYLVETGFPRLSTSSFSGGLPRGVERVEYEINLEICPHLYVGKSPTEPGINLEP